MAIVKDIKIILDSEYSGMNSGWPTRYIGLISELYKHNKLVIYAPGDTSMLKVLYPRSTVYGSYATETSIPSGRRNNRFIHLLKDILIPSRYNVRDYPIYCPELYRIIKQDKRNYDASIYFGRYAYIFYGEGDLSNIQVCDFCDSRYRELHNRLKKSKSLNDKLKIIYDIIYVTRIKIRYIPSKLIIIAITDKDCEYISMALKNNKVIAIPNGIEYIRIDQNEEYYKIKYNSPYVTFIGTLNYEPNEQSILYILNDIWPKLADRYPNLIFRIIGRSPSDKIKQTVRSIDRVELIGPVDNVYSYSIMSKIFLAPIFSGAGMKNKFLESFNSGTPIITTPEGVIGIEFIPKKHGNVGSSTNELIEAAISLLECSYSDYKNYVVECRSLAKKYSWDKVGDQLNGLI